MAITYSIKFYPKNRKSHLNLACNKIIAIFVLVLKFCSRHFQENCVAWFLIKIIGEMSKFGFFHHDQNVISLILRSNLLSNMHIIKRYEHNCKTHNVGAKIMLATVDFIFTIDCSTKVLFVIFLCIFVYPYFKKSIFHPPFTFWESKFSQCFLWLKSVISLLYKIF